jgi:hypothetical protein
MDKPFGKWRCKDNIKIYDLWKWVKRLRGRLTDSRVMFDGRLYY